MNRDIKTKIKLLKTHFYLCFLGLITVGTLLVACKKNDGTIGMSVPEIISLSGYTNSLYVKLTDVGTTKYEIRYSVNNDMSVSVSKEISAVESEVTGFKPATVYYLQVRAQKGASWTEWSEIKKCKTATFSTIVTSINMLGKEHDPKFPNNTWDSRKEALRDVIFQDNNNPDILGLQEGMDLTQTMEVVSFLNGKYDSYVSDKEISARAIFWKPEKYNLLESDDVEAYDGTVTGRERSKYATFVHLREKATGKDIMVFNIHPRSGGTADEQRVRGVVANVIAGKAKAKSEQAGNVPVVVIGDFNNQPGSVIGGLPPTPVVFTNNGFTDTFVASPLKINAHYATHDDISLGTATIGTNGNKRIDYVFIYPLERIAVSEYATIINFANNSNIIMKQPIPTDHRPVRAVIHLHY